MSCTFEELDCSDDEKYDVKLRENGEWEPPPETILELFEKMDKEGVGALTLEWKCLGRRPPTPANESEPSANCGVAGGVANEDKQAANVKDEYFDFEVEKGQLRLRPSGDVGPRGSAKKKTTSLDAILSNMARHRRMDMMDQDPESPPQSQSQLQQQQSQQQQQQQSQLQQQQSQQLQQQQSQQLQQQQQSQQQQHQQSQQQQ